MILPSVLVARVPSPDGAAALAEAARASSTAPLSAVEIEVDDATGKVTIRDKTPSAAAVARPKAESFDDNLLARHQPAASTEPEQLERMRRAAWQAQGVAVIDPTRLAATGSGR
ncbi:MAG: hypothetical protein ACLQJR_28580 [Stellaceae bacterium]